jgi:hypothetical protein
MHHDTTEVKQAMERVIAKAKERTDRIKAMLDERFRGAEWVATCHDCATPVKLDLTATTAATIQTLELRWQRCQECDTRAGMKSSGVPENLLGCRIETWEPRNPADQQVPRYVNQWLENRDAFPFVILSGSYGNGKSHIAAGLLRLTIQAHGTARWWTQGSFLTALRARYDDHYAPDAVRLAKQTGLLVLDDVGLSVGGKDEIPKLHEVLDERYGNRRPTVMTTNIGNDEFAAVLGPRMADRLREVVMHWIKITAESSRPDNRKKHVAKRGVKE